MASLVDRPSSRRSNQLASGAQLTPSLWTFGGAALIALAVVIAYWPARHGGFVMDDELLLVYNPIIKAHDGLYRFWFTKDALDYWPITNTTFWLEWRLWGMNTTGYHVANLILHIIDSLLIWLILKRLAIPWPWLAAMLFAVHPINVESVAWISQRKNVLALLFFLLSILWWLNAEDERKAADESRKCKAKKTSHRSYFLLWYSISLMAFVLAMLSKGSVAILPAVLLLIIWWKCGTVTWYDCLRYAPFFAVAVTLTAVDLWFQTHGNGDVIRQVTPIQRLLGAGGVVWFYLEKALVPINLAFIYPQWNIDPGNFLWWLPLLATIAVTGFLIWKRNSAQAYWVRPVLFAWLFFCGALVPVMGFTDVGYMRYSLVADHYEHIAVIGVVALAAAALHAVSAKLQAPLVRQSITAGAGIIVLLFIDLTWQQSSIYADALVLYQDTVIKNPESWLVQSNFGLELSRRDKSEEAIPHFQKALQLNPICAAAHFRWGNALVDLNRTPEALDHYREAIKIAPNHALARYRYGTALQSLGRAAEAEQEFRRSLECNPFDAEAQNTFGLMLAERHQFSEAIDHFRQAVDANPEFLQPYINLASATAALGRYADAIPIAQQALKLALDNGDAVVAEGIQARLQFYQSRISGSTKSAAPNGSSTKP